MRVDGRQMRTIWPAGGAVEIIDQTRLPFELSIRRLETPEKVAEAIAAMRVRGAPLIGAAAAYGLALAARCDPSRPALEKAAALLFATRPTAVNLGWALERMMAALLSAREEERALLGFRLAGEIAEEDVAINRAIGAHGLALFEKAFAEKGRPVEILTHCNAGWLATVDWGTALAPVYRAFDVGIKVHVWVGETRPRNQGASLTAWELARHGVPFTLLVDSAAGPLMREGRVDFAIVGTDRTTAEGEVANKIGTYMMALAARDSGVPFYVALPSPSIDWALAKGASIPIECRDAREVTHIEGWSEDGRRLRLRLSPEESPAFNPAFDVTPARLVTALITERGLCAASREGLAGLFPEHAASAREEAAGTF